MKKVLTISVAAYNAAEYLEKCLESFVKCTNLDKMEILVIDDGSVDKTAKIAREYENKFPESIKLIAKGNGGHGSTINTSIRHATAKYFKIVDADDWVDTKNIDRLVEYLEHNDVSLVINPYYEVSAVDGTKKIIVPCDEAVKKLDICKLEEIALHIFWAMHAMTLNMSIIKKMGPVIDEKCFYVDAEYIVFPIIDIDDVVVLDYPIYNYLLGTSTQSMNLLNMRKRRDQHLKVLKRLVLYYENVKNNLSEGKKKLILNKIASVINLQYVLVMGGDIKTSYNEIIEMEHWLKNNSIELYHYSIIKGRNSKSGYIKLLELLRYTKFILYKPIVGLCQTLKVIK